MKVLLFITIVMLIALLIFVFVIGICSTGSLFWKTIIEIIQNNKKIKKYIKAKKNELIIKEGQSNVHDN